MEQTWNEHIHVLILNEPALHIAWDSFSSKLSSFWCTCSVQNGSTDVLEHILSHDDCDVDPINRINRATPLHLACQLEDDGIRSYMVESLLEAGADTKIRDKNGELAITFIPPTDEETRKLFRMAQAQAITISQDDIASGEWQKLIQSLC